MGIFGLFFGAFCAITSLAMGGATLGLAARHPAVAAFTVAFWVSFMWVSTWGVRQRRRAQRRLAVQREHRLRARRASHRAWFQDARTAIRAAGERDRDRFMGGIPIDLADDIPLDLDAEF